MEYVNSTASMTTVAAIPRRSQTTSTPTSRTFHNRTADRRAGPRLRRRRPAGFANNNDLDEGDDGAVSDDFTGEAGINRVVFGIIPGRAYACTSQPVGIDIDNEPNDASSADAASDYNVPARSRA